VHKIRSEKESLLQSAGCQLKDVKWDKRRLVNQNG
jgi:hypothetical protein